MMYPSRPASFLLFAAAFLACFSGRPLPSAYAAGEGVCDYDQITSVTVTPVFDEPVADLSKGLFEINQMSRGSSQVIPHYDSVTLGVTQYHPVIEFRAPMLQQELADGTFCARVEHIDAVIGYRNVTVYVARELSADPCAA
jgi:hypothetical protein